MNKKKKGFTLLELIIAMGITITIIGIAGSMLITGNKVFSDSDVKSTLQIEGQEIQEKISDIGMQGIEIVSASDSPLVIKSYVKEDDDFRYFKIQKDVNTSNFKIYEDTHEDFSSGNNPIIYENIRSLTITRNNGGKSVNFEIILTRKDIDHKIAFTISFRNG